MQSFPGPDQSSKLFEVSSCPQVIWKAVPDMGSFKAKIFYHIDLCLLVAVPVDFDTQKNNVFFLK